MKAKFTACVGDASYVNDLELAMQSYCDPLTPAELLRLTELYTALQVVNHRVEQYSDMMLNTMVWLGREAEALSHARLRSRATEHFNGLLTIY